MATQRILFSRFPELRGKLPFTQLGEFPTPVQHLDGLGSSIGLDSLWIKRDDLSAGDYGGNKIRKLEFLLADAMQKDARRVITFGGLGSNHALATAINCARLGLHCTAILTPEPVTEAVKRTLRHHLHLGTRLEICESHTEVRSIADRLKAEFGTKEVYEIPFGGSSWLGTAGFVEAGLELAQQIHKGEIPQPDRIYLACGTAGSTAGLALGLLAAEINTSIQAVQVTPRSFQLEAINRRLFAETVQGLSELATDFPRLEFEDADMAVRTDQLGEGYAIPTEAGREAAKILREMADLPSSLTYTAKAMAALLNDARLGLLKGKNVLFWNTYNSHPLPGFKEIDVLKVTSGRLRALFSD